MSKTGTETGAHGQSSRSLRSKVLASHMTLLEEGDIVEAHPTILAQPVEEDGSKLVVLLKSL